MHTYSPDILNVHHGILVHQVNCKGSMGAGIAKKVKDLFPKAFQEYKKHILSFRPGMIQVVQIKDNLCVCNLAGQDDYRGKQNTDYKAVQAGFQKLSKVAQEKGLPIYVPYLMGCGLGGGDWPTYRKIIRDACPEAKICCLHFADLDVYTISFSRLKSLPEDVIPVSIARYAPKSLRENIASYPKLFPPQHLLSAYKSGKVSQKKYKDTYYREVLSGVGIEKALQDLKGFGDKVALVCYEKAGDFCHRKYCGGLDHICHVPHG